MHGFFILNSLIAVYFTMVGSSNSIIEHVAAHYIGNQTNNESLRLSEECMDVTDERLQGLLRTYFLHNFTSHEFYNFTFSNEDHTLNPIFQFAKNIFEDRETFHENSINIAKHLYQAMQHPNIKSGELYVAYIGNIAVGNTMTDAIGIFKSENKDNFLKLSTSFTLDADEGINVKKLDKGCLITNLQEEEGYKVLIVDTVNKSEAHFWKDDFLNVKPYADAYRHTQNVMELTKSYVAEKMDKEFEINKADKIDLLNRSAEFFKSKETFHLEEYENEVLVDQEVIHSFRNFGNEAMGKEGFDIIDHFEISAPAVKKQAKIFKSVLKLDKNFHIYIHGNRELIEKGFDEITGKHFYKLYFDSEQ
jgi:hypothetical protein